MGSVGELIGFLIEPFDQSFIQSSSSEFYLGRRYLSPGGSIVHGVAEGSQKQLVSALPHIGFGYMFGTQGAQYLSLEYNQVFQGNWVMNAYLKKSTLEGFFRNTAFSRSTSGFSLSRNTDKFGLSFKGNMGKLQREWSGGVIDETLLDEFAPLFIPVRKASCNSELNEFNVSASSYFRIAQLKNTSIGYTTESKVYGLNRLFSEQDTLYGLYATNYFDTLSSQDQYHHSTVDHISALYLKNDQISYHIGAKGAYWNYRNMGMYRDTVEIDIEQKFQLRKKKLQFSHFSALNLFGAWNGWNLKHQLTYGRGPFIFSVKNNTGKRIPLVFQRFYSSNNTYYSNLSLDLEGYMEQELGISYSQKNLKSALRYTYALNRGVYYFDPILENWTSTSSLSNNQVHQLDISLRYGSKKVNVIQKYTYSFATELQGIIPAHHLRGSLDYKLGLFKDKILQLVIGLNYSLSSKTLVIPVRENMGVYDFLSIDQTNFQKGMLNLGAYTAIEIETFRFFFKINNLGYLWNDLRWNYMEQIYLPELTLRAGITWNFWN